MLSEKGKIAKRELEELNQSKRRLKNLQEELRLWQDLDGGLGSPSLELNSAGGEKVPYAEKRVIKIEELKALISTTIDDALTKEDKFLKDISNLDILSQNLLMERYMTGKSLYKIIREFNYSESHIYRLYDKAFERLSKK